MKCIPDADKLLGVRAIGRDAMDASIDSLAPH